MRVILSRKGFDSAYGGIPSPILPGTNQLISLPIPSKKDSITYSDLLLKDYGNYYSLISSLQRNKRKHIIQPSDTCHLDPDIYPVMKRLKNWKPLFGQIGASQTHLQDNFIGKNDLFLFFGWFRHTTMKDQHLSFDKDRKYSLHILFGYFQVDQVLTNKSEIASWMTYHPHIQSQDRFLNKTNCIYVAKDHLSWNKDVPGAGPFEYLDQSLILTAKDKEGNYLSRSKWFFTTNYPFGKKIAMTYHTKKSWQKDYFQSASIGQEFILEDCKEAERWAKKIIELNASRKN